MTEKEYRIHKSKVDEVRRYFKKYWHPVYSEGVTPYQRVELELMAWKLVLHVMELDHA